ncbi:MAG: FkbM family methyltransferase [Candidatus Eisenbacteria bacterium]|nr:FkbM family methyltransferase [Candidatus Eisenbacteria bacterium]
MKIEDRAKRILERFAGLIICRRFGIDAFVDIGTRLPDCQMDVILDVGANVGQSAKLFMRRFPASQILCFEPAGNTYRRLQQVVRGNENVRCFRLALGDTSGTTHLVHEGFCENYHVLGEARQVDQLELEEVDMVTLDDFCRDRAIGHVNYLKIDTEGWDLHVLRGAERMLREQRVDLVQVEAGMNPANDTHVPLEDLKRHLERRSYYLFGLYEQVPEWPTVEPHLRRTNPVFVSQKVIRENAIGQDAAWGARRLPSTPMAVVWSQPTVRKRAGRRQPPPPFGIRR